jgi:hypothetical protein
MKYGWQRIILLIILGYEAAGCILGGSFLIAAPDGRLMNLPIDTMHGFFTDFLFPGIILLALGTLNVMALFGARKVFIRVVVFCLVARCLSIWFVVEIIVLQQLH